MSQKLEAIFRLKNPELTPAQVAKCNSIKEKALSLAIEFNPTDTREKSIALTKLEESVMWAIKGVTL